MTLVRRALRPSSFLLIALSFASCRALHPDPGADRAGALPPAYSAPGVGLSLSNAWWTTFQSDEIDRLMARAFDGNLTLARAAARLRQTRAAARKAGAGRLPELTGSLSAESSQRHTGSGENEGDVTTETYSLGLAASYELDLWGRIDSARQSADLAAFASRDDLEAAAMTLAAQVADRWLQLIEARAQFGLIQKQIGSNQETMELLKQRIGKSGARLLDVYQQEQALLATQAALPIARQRQELLLTELALLLGCPAGTDLGLRQEAFPALLPTPDTGIPADLLVQRPDVRAALARLQAAGWDVAAARADRLPAIRLTARHTYSAESTADLFDNWLSNLAAGLAAPLIDGGRRRAEFDRTRAVMDEQLAASRQIVLEAFREVEDALIRENRLLERADATDRQLASSRQALDEARRRYLGGASDYLAVLVSLRTTQQLERDTLAARREWLSNRVSLYRALGGSWAAPAAESLSNRKSTSIQSNPTPPAGPTGRQQGEP